MSDDIKINPEGSEEFSQHNPPNPGKVVIDKDDLSKGTKVTLKRYLTERSRVNTYPVTLKAAGDGRDLEEELDTSSTQISHTLNAEKFIDIDDSSEESKNLRAYSDSGFFNDIQYVKDINQPSPYGAPNRSDRPEPQDPITLRDFYDKSLQGPGHNLLRSIKPSRKYQPIPNEPDPVAEPTARDENLYVIPEDAPEIQRRISQVLQTNRFSPSSESPYIVNNEYSSPSSALGSIQPKLGVYTANSPAGDLAIEDLRKVAMSLMLKQTGHALGDSDDPFDFNDFSVLLGPSNLQGDPNVDASEMLARNAFGASKKVQSRSQVNLGLDDEARRGFMAGKNPLDGDGDFVSIYPTSPLNGGGNTLMSHGAPNSYLETFTGNPLAALTFIFQGVLTTMTLGIVLGIFLDLLAQMTNPERAEGRDPSTLPLGKYTDHPAAALAHLGIPHLSKPFVKCIAYGLAAFFSLGEPDDDADNFAALPIWFAQYVASPIKFLMRIKQSQGFYTSIIRTIMRDNQKLFDLDPIQIAQDVAVATITGGIQGLIEGLIGTFSGMKSFDFFMACAVVGEKCLMDEARDFSGLGNFIDRLPDNGPTRAIKSRVNKTTNALAWRHRSAPAMMILPGSLLAAYDDVGTSSEPMISAAIRVGDAEGDEKFRRSIKFTNDGRLTAEDVKSFEDDLESEYMPFYFQDLRTNEIISFHAFVDSISDSFSVQYQDTPAYGRVDPVKVYSSTTRNINLSFTLLSTSQEDFDSMWFSVNKLTQMLYPQWSKGRQMEGKGKKFIMPFSQIQTASPMIRLRLGDFVRGNGSKFALARLFGAGQGKDVFNYGKTKEPGAANLEASSKGPAQKADLTKAADIKQEKSAFSKNSFAILKRSTSHGYTTYKDSGGPEMSLMGSAKLPFQSWTRCDGVVKIIEAQDRPGSTIEGATFAKLKDEDVISKKPFQYKVKFEDKDPANPNKDPCYMLVLATDLKKISATKIADSAEEEFNIEKLGVDFLKESNNALMAAYQSTRGRGLAGFITSMAFDYSQSTYETSSLTRRAPTMIKITMAFSPVHDIAPGMDADGGNRAPLYPVGSISSRMAGDELCDSQEFGVGNKKDGVKDKFNQQQTKTVKRSE